MLQIFKDYNILITGAAQRVGKELALKFAKAGANIFLHYNESHDQVLNLQHQIINLGVKCEIFSYDLSSQKNCIELISTIYSKFASIDLLINNAALFLPDKTDNVTFDNLNRHIYINAYAPFFLIQELYKQTIIHPNNNLNVINILDYSVNIIPDNFISYNLSKKLLAEITKICAKNFAPIVRVNAIAPSGVIKGVRESQEFFDNYREKSPLKINPTIDELFEFITVLSQSKSTTGQIITCDGGLSLVDISY